MSNGEKSKDSFASRKQGNEKQKQKQEQKKDTEVGEKQEARRAELMEYFTRDRNAPPLITTPSSTSSSSSSSGSNGSNNITSSPKDSATTTKSRWVDGDCVWEETTSADGARYVTERVETAWGALKVRKGPFYDAAARRAAKEREGAEQQQQQGKNKSEKPAKEEPAAAREEMKKEDAVVVAGTDVDNNKPRAGEVRHRVRRAGKCAAWLRGDGYPDTAPDGLEAGKDDVDDAESTSSQETIRPYKQPGRPNTAESESDYEDVWLKIATQEEKGKRVLRRVDKHI